MVCGCSKAKAKRFEKLAGNDPNTVKAKEHYSTNVEAYKAMVTKAFEFVRTQLAL